MGLADRVARFAASLRALGIRREERVLIALLDTIDWPTAFLGCLKAGVVAVPVNTLMTEDDYRFILADSHARMLVVSDALYPRFQKLIGQSSDLEHVIVSGESVMKGHKRFEDLIESAMAEAHTAPTVRDDIAFWLYTSGSTGKPKAAVHVHADLRLTNDLYAAPILGLTENDVVYSVERLLKINLGPANLFAGVLKPGSVAAVDPQTVKFSLSKTFSPFLSTVPAIRVFRPSVAKRVISRMPDWPAVSFAQLSCWPAPSDVTTP